MVNAKLEAQRHIIKHHWCIGTRSAKQIHEMTSILLRTVENILKKLRKTGDIKNKQGNGRPKKFLGLLVRI